ncbi:Beta-monoglucosyldiacylglycerol synthase [Frankliniella fusca]|uniref:Beta-monoglucosyldiacylglycerol synthase n=1 Tax=Frankliniella fusca TaxID=407009 RepID=A0AAE1HHF5_9NEOP|nr:Beta-monoglucosyldiacylglycerol synthase [Frankliniella fusca]
METSAICRIEIINFVFISDFKIKTNWSSYGNVLSFVFLNISDKYATMQKLKVAQKFSVETAFVVLLLVQTPFGL